MLKELQECTACLSDPQLLDIIKIIGFTHDTGKCTSFFQEYLHNHDIKFNPFLKSHSTLSSIYAYYATRHRNINNNFLSFLAIMLIQGHHGRIPSPSTVVKRIEEHRKELEQQFKNLLHTEELDTALNCAKVRAVAQAIFHCKYAIFNPY
jgi:CRISPR-associated endonuclease Cas3-HD